MLLEGMKPSATLCPNAAANRHLCDTPELLESVHQVVFRGLAQHLQGGQH